MMDIEIHKSVNTSLPFQTNAFWELFDQRMNFAASSTNPVTSTIMKIVTIDTGVVFQKKADISEIARETIDGKTWCYSPMTDDEKKISSLTDAIFYYSPRSVGIVFSYQGEHFDDRRSAKTIVKAILSEKISKLITTDLSGIRSDGKKIADCEFHRNQTGSWEAISLLFTYDVDFLKSIYPVIATKSSAQYDVIGVNDENPDYSIDQFIDDFTSAFETQFKILYPDQDVTIKRYSI